jgi:uncharacterized membrane protein YeaQ/YmgE (transglycosylase-associated protein family)
MSGALLIVAITAILGIVLGWLVPVLFKSKRPYGLFGDMLVCAILSAALAFVEWNWLLPALGFGTGWLAVLLAISDPLGFGLVCLWLMRKIKG